MRSHPCGPFLLSSFREEENEVQEVECLDRVTTTGTNQNQDANKIHLILGNFIHIALEALKEAPTSCRPPTISHCLP